MADYIGAIPIVTMEMIQQSIMRARLSANATRKIEAQKRLDYYHGEQLDHLDKVLQAQFSHPERLRLQKQFSNITRRIINEVSVVYKRSPQRRLMLNDSPVDGPKADVFKELYEEARVDAVLKKANRYTNLLNTVGVQAVWRNDRVELDVLTPDILNVVQDAMDPTRASAVIIEQAFADTVVLEGPGNPYGSKKLYIAWTDEMHQVFDEQGHARPDLANEAGRNPYGRIPITWFRDAYPDGYFWNCGTGDLINAQEMLNVQLTELNQLIKMQSFSIPVIIGDGPAEGVTIDPSNYISIPLGDAAAGKGQPDFKFVTPSPKIGDLIDAIKETVRRIADDWGLSMDSFKLSGSATSGLSLKLQNVRLIERREDDVELYSDYEKDLFDSMRAVHNAHCAPADQLPLDAEVKTNFAELDFPEDPTAEDARWVTRINQNVKSRADWLMDIDPDIKTREEAEKRLKENADINQRTRTQLVGADPASMLNALAKGQPAGDPQAVPGQPPAAPPAAKPKPPMGGKP